MMKDSVVKLSYEMPEKQIHSIPKLSLRSGIKPKETYDSNKVYPFQYEAKSHIDLPHIVKFSGGKTSGMLLFTLLEGGLLDAKRGDAIVFNNTGAEHPSTYEFVKECKEVVESKYNIPFFWIEFQTYEDARSGEYKRIPSFRLVNSQPYSEENSDGYKWRGEVFEELLSWKGYVPTFFQRICTKNLKLETTRFFLKEWLANKESTERLGHFGNKSRIEDTRAFAQHQRAGGKTPEKIFQKKKKFLKQAALCRPAQAWHNFSSAVVPFENKTLEGKTMGRNAHFGEGGVEYVAFIGLRYDEKQRIHKVKKRNEGGEDSTGYEGEFVYMPLDGMNIATNDVEEFWKKQNWGLKLNPEDNLSNCTFCFLKGSQALRNVYAALEKEESNMHKDTPCDLNWWIQLEETYGRNMKKEKREVKKSITNNFIGFFGVDSEFTYARLLQDVNKNSPDEFSEELLPCDCTD
jgi:3'-phosphoadenosine 5'-phosphosulfate sulfotransferase (PAPS reductase)/FAD synthetase